MSKFFVWTPFRWLQISRSRFDYHFYVWVKGHYIIWIPRRKR